MKTITLPIFILLLAAFCSRSTALAVEEPDDATKAPTVVDESRYENRLDHDPNGIGKFYMGREIAHVMGFGPGGRGRTGWNDPRAKKRNVWCCWCVRCS